MLVNGIGASAGDAEGNVGRNDMGAKSTPDLSSGVELTDETPVNLIEIAGVIKWFDASK